MSGCFCGCRFVSPRVPMFLVFFHFGAVLNHIARPSATAKFSFSLWCQLEHPSLPATTLGFPLLQVRPCEVLVCGRGRVGVGIHDLSDWFDYASSWISWLELPFPSKNSFRLGGLTSVGRFLWEFPWMPHTSLRPQYEDLRGHQTA